MTPKATLASSVTSPLAAIGCATLLTVYAAAIIEAPSDLRAADDET